MTVRRYIIRGQVSDIPAMQGYHWSVAIATAS